MPRHSRDPKLEQFWRRHLKQHAASGSSIRDYCFRHALQTPSFYYWRRTIQQRDRRTSSGSLPVPAAATAEPAFLPVAVVDPPFPRRSAIVVQWPNGVRVRVGSGCDRSLLADVLTLLGQRGAADLREARPC